MGGAGPRLRVLHADILNHLACGADNPETRDEFDKRWLQWHCNKEEYVEVRMKKAIHHSLQDCHNRVRRRDVFDMLKCRRLTEEKARAAEKKAAEEEEEAGMDDWVAERERQAADDFMRDEDDARAKQEEDLEWFFSKDLEEMREDEECWLEPDLHEPMV